MTELRRGDLDAFVRAPRDAYGRGSPSVSPLRADLARWLDGGRNPAFRGPEDIAFWTAHRGGRVLGRITAHVHHASNARHGWRRAFFGFFDCADDPAAAGALLGAAEDWARARGLREIRGRFDLTAMQQIGVVTAGFEHPPYADQNWTPPHLPRLLDGAGYRPRFPMTTHETALAGVDPETLLGPRQRALLASNRFRWHPITRRTLRTRLEDARRVLNDAFEANPMFVPLSEAEYRFQAEGLAWVIDPRVSAILHEGGAPVAGVVCIPDVNPLLRRVGPRPGPLAPWYWLRQRTTNRRAVLVYLGTVRRLQVQGVGALVMHRLLTSLKAAGYETMGSTWIADENGPSLRQAEKLGARPLHRLHLFAKDLD